LDPQNISFIHPSLLAMYQLAVIEDKIICTPDQLNRDPVEVPIDVNRSMIALTETA